MTDNFAPSVGADAKDTGRLEAFSDGVFSIAMTLLVLELKVPSLSGPLTAKSLWWALAVQWPSYLAFLTSFLTVLIMWVNHHGIFRLVRRCDAPLLFANGFLLLLVTVVPFPTALVAAYLRTEAAPVACVVYCGTFVIISATYGLLLLAASRGGFRLLAPGAAAEVRQRIRHCYRVGVPLYMIATLVAPIAPWLSLAICTFLWAFWSAVSMGRGRTYGE